MRLLVQRVKEAAVRVEDELVGSIGHGLLVLVGFHKDDKPEDTPWFAEKLVSVRLFQDAEHKMNLSLSDIGGQVLLVSQFTLYATCDKGRRPEFTRAMGGPQAEILYQKFVSEVTQILGSVQTGRFGAYMEVSLINDGPVTLLIEKS